jgi:N-acetylmuramoyl-L-alanine amidase
MTGETPSESTGMHSYEGHFKLPGNMRAVMIRPQTAAHDGQGGAVYTDALPIIPHTLFDEASALGMNTVIIETVLYNDGEITPVYTGDMNRTDTPDMLADAIDAARTRGLSVFLTFDINSVVNRDTTNSVNALNTLITELHKFTVKYRSDGIILDNFYNTRCSESFRRYMAFGAGTGYDNWLFDTVRNFFKTAADTVRLTDNSIPVGIMLRDVWANFHVDNSRGSGTTADFESYYDGFADTLGFIANGYVDFAIAHAPDAVTTEQVDTPFLSITAYWNRACYEAGIPLYVLHHNQRMGENSHGWLGDDQLLRQITAAQDLSVYGGSVFYCVNAFRENRLDSTMTLRAFFADEINEETLFEDLRINSPRSLNFTTADAVVIFQGTHDDNFPVFINGVETELNEAGNFYVEKPLTTGMNYFTLRHKGQTVNYAVERRIAALLNIDSSIGIGTVLEVEGETFIIISATAYRGAEVTAEINGQTVKLTEQDFPLDDPVLNISYAHFTASYRVPAGIVGREQNLGNIRITASYRGFVNTIMGATVRVLALPEPSSLPPQPNLEVTWFDRDNAGSGDIAGRIAPVRSPNERVRFVRANADNTQVLPGDTTGDERDPTLSPWQAGTIDYFRSQSGEFYITANGKRLHREHVTLENGFGLGENALTVVSEGTLDGNAFLRISLDHRTSFNLRTGGVQFHTAWGGDFNVRSFNSTHVYIDFDNVTSVTGLPDFSQNLVFSAARWETITTDGIPKFRLVLQLRQRGVFAGHSATYDTTNGDLVFTFRALPNTLDGMSIVIDPGHGLRTLDGETVFDTGAVGHIRESDANIAIARLLRDILRSRGADAVMLPTHDTLISIADRPRTARTQHNADMFISIHSNAVTRGTNIRGQEVWYFTPFSQPLAANISRSMAEYFRDNVYSDRTLHNRGSKFAAYQVTNAHDFPAVLVETGFVTNLEDAMALASPTHQAGIAAAIADGIFSIIHYSLFTFH